MTPVLFVAIALAGGVGATVRMFFDGLLQSWLSRSRKNGFTSLPIGTVVINLTGSFLLGLLLGLASAQLFNAEWAEIVGVGFLGGYTTFSTASFETVRLIQERRYGAALINGLGVLLAGVLLAWLGWWLGSAA